MSARLFLANPIKGNMRLSMPAARSLATAAIRQPLTQVTMLPNGGIVKKLYDEILPATPTGALFIDSSTISVDDARAIHAAAGEEGFAHVDAPVSGGVKGAVAGTLAFMVGGEDEAFAEAARLLRLRGGAGGG